MRIASMWKLLPMVVLGLALALPGAAFGAKIKQRGTLSAAPSATVKLTLVKRHGRPVGIRGLAFRDLPVTCSDGSVRPFWTGPIHFSIRGSRFSQSAPILGEGIVNAVQYVKGRFRARGRRAVGTVRVRFLMTTGGTCDSFSLRWVTRRR